MSDVRRVVFRDVQIVTEDFNHNIVNGHTIRHDGLTLFCDSDWGSLNYSDDPMYLIGSRSTKWGCQWEDLV